MKLSFFIFRMPDLMHSLSSTCYIYKLFNLHEVKEIINSFLEANVLKLLIPLAGGFPSLHPFPFSSTTSRSLLLFYPISSSLLNLKLNL